MVHNIQKFICLFVHFPPEMGHSGQIGTAVTGTHNFVKFQKSHFIHEKKILLLEFHKMSSYAHMGKLIGLKKLIFGPFSKVSMSRGHIF